MTDRKLRNELQRLHDEIEKTQTVDETGRRLLKDIDAHIRDLLARSDANARPGLSEGLERAIRHFEVTHPALTAALSDLLSTLSNAGV